MLLGSVGNLASHQSSPRWWFLRCRERKRPNSSTPISWLPRDDVDVTAEPPRVRVWVLWSKSLASVQVSTCLFSFLYLWGREIAAWVASSRLCHQGGPPGRRHDWSEPWQFSTLELWWSGGSDALPLPGEPCLPQANTGCTCVFHWLSQDYFLKIQLFWHMVMRALFPSCLIIKVFLVSGFTGGRLSDL